ncbi:MAG: DNA polymerase-3 subunit beta [Planctomycetota bacterium]|jgi:DNA polymerase-3 subunit beta
MKVTCDREKLREGLAIANQVVPSKSTKPVLENVCLVATDNALELIGTDQEVSLRYRIDDVQVDEPGPVVIPARIALDFVRDLTGERCTLETTDTACHIRGEGDACELVTVDPEEFPVVPRFGDEKTLSLQGGSFVRLVQQTSFAAAREPGRYAMHGVLTEIEVDTLRMVATDGRRLALSEIPVDAAEPMENPAIVPTKGMQLFCRVIADPLDQIQLSFSDNQVGLKTRNAEIFARLIDGEFPRYSAVLPAETSQIIDADRELFVKKLRLVANVAGDEARAVRLSVTGNQMELFGQSAGRGEAKARMDVEFKGETAEIAFNPDYVLEGLKHCSLDTVRLQFNEKNSPGEFRLGETYRYIVMPITLDT